MNDINGFLIGLISDLLTRCSRLTELMEESLLQDDVAQYAQEMKSRLKVLHQQITVLSSSDMTREAVLFRQAYEEYQDFSREVAMVEQFAIPVMLRYDDRDRYATRLIKSLMIEIGCPPELAPIASATSSQYYWAKPELRVISMPAGDIGGILGWPDLLHEIAHILLTTWPDFLKAFAPIVRNHFKRKRQDIADIGGGEHDNRWLLNAQMKWGQREEATWQIEMAANLIATYVVGPSFGWQHLRLFINHSNTPFSPSPGDPLVEHPADQAQLDGILMMLSLLNLDQERQNIAKRWSEILTVGGYSQAPQGFDLYYPHEILAGITQTVFDSCKTHKLVAFTDRQKNASQWITLIDQAWHRFNTAPANYSQWEAETLSRVDGKLKKAL